MFPRDTMRMIEFFFWAGVIAVLCAVGFGLWHLLGWAIG